MTDFQRRIFSFLTGTLFCSDAFGLFMLWMQPIEQGVASLRWPTAPAEILACQFRSEFDPETTSNSDYEVRNTSSRIAVAYAVDTASGSQFYETFQFDAFAPRVGHDGFFGGDAYEVRSVLRARPKLEVHYNPADPAQAVMQPGIPFYSSCLLIFPCTLLALATGTFRLAFRPRMLRRVERDRDARSDDPTTTLLGAILLIFAAMTLILFLRPAYSLMTGRLAPWWMLPTFYVLALLILTTPSALRRWKPTRSVFACILLPMIFVIPAVGVTGIIGVFLERNDRGFRFDLLDADCVARLDAKNPVVAEWACWEIVRREGPRDSIPALRRLLFNPQVNTRRAAVCALGKMGVAAMPALDDLTAAAKRHDDCKIRRDLELLIRRLKSYQDTQEEVTVKRMLLQDPSPTTRQIAAFWLGQVGELAASALPDLETALVDPANEPIKINIQAAIIRIRHSLHISEKKTASS